MPKTPKLFQAKPVAEYSFGLAKLSSFMDHNKSAEKLVALGTFAIATLSWLHLAFTTGPTFSVFWSAPVGLFIADGITYLAHYYFDNVDPTVLSSSSPILAKLAEDFQMHHEDPIAVRDKHFMAGTGASSIAGWPFLTLGFILAKKTTVPGISLACFLISAVATMVPNIHIWSHTRKSPWLVKALQSTGILLSPEVHKLHHIRVDGNDGLTGAFSGGNYALVTGWTNSILDLFFGTPAYNVFKKQKVTVEDETKTKPDIVESSEYIWNIATMIPFVCISLHACTMKLDGVLQGGSPAMVLSFTVIVATVIGIMNHAAEGTPSWTFWNNMDTVACAATAAAWLAYPGGVSQEDSPALQAQAVVVVATALFFMTTWTHPSSAAFLNFIVSLAVVKAWTELPFETAAPATAAMLLGGVLYASNGKLMHGFWHLALAHFVGTILFSVIN